MGECVTRLKAPHCSNGRCLNLNSLRAVAKSLKQKLFGACKPGLPAQFNQLVEQCGAPIPIQVSSGLIQ